MTRISTLVDDCFPRGTGKSSSVVFEELAVIWKRVFASKRGHAVEVRNTNSVTQRPDSPVITDQTSTWRKQYSEAVQQE